MARYRNLPSPTGSRFLLGHGHPVAEALTGGFHAALLICGFVCLAGAPIALILVRPTNTNRR